MCVHVQLYVTLTVRMEGLALHLMNVVVLLDGVEALVHNVSCELSMFIYMYCNAISAICDPVCENGGICTTPNECSCTAGWNGSTCTQRKLPL